MSTSPNASFVQCQLFGPIVTAMSFAIRGAAMGSWTEEFGLTNEQVGWINGTAFGLHSAMVFGGPCVMPSECGGLAWLLWVTWPASC